MSSFLAVPSMEFSPYFAECPTELNRLIFIKKNEVCSCLTSTVFYVNAIHLYSKIIINHIVINLYNLVSYMENDTLGDQEKFLKVASSDII